MKYKLTFPKAQKEHEFTAEKLMERYNQMNYRPAKDIEEAVKNLNSAGFKVITLEGNPEADNEAGKMSFTINMY